MNIPPWVSLTVAAIAFCGVIINALFTWKIAQRKNAQDEALQGRKEEHEAALAKLNDSLRRQAEADQIWQLLNEKNWERVQMGYLLDSGDPNL